MLNMVVGVVIINEDVYGCIIEQRDDCEDFIHLLTGDCYSASEVDSYVPFPSIGHICGDDVQDKLKEAYKKHILRRE